MTPLALGAVVAALVVAALLFGTPVAFALGAVAIGTLLWLAGADGFMAVADSFLWSMESLALVAVPLFVLMGAAASLSPVGGDLREWLKRLLHQLPGGLIVANITASTLFSGLSATGSATCLAVGRDGLGELRRRRYPDGVAAGALAAAGSLAILIPPSLPLIVFGVISDLSIARLFLAGLLPGLMIAGLFVLWALVGARRWAGRYGDFARGYTRAETWAPLPRTLPFLAVIAGVLAALWTGIARPFEAAGLGALACVVFATALYGMWRPGALVRIFVESTRESGAVLIVIAAAAFFAHTLIHFDVTTAAEGAVRDLALPGWMLVVAVNLLLFVAGLFLPAVAVIVISAPVLVPLMVDAGFDPYWFAVMVTANLQIGLITPPVGLNLYAVRALAPEVEVRAVLAGAVPFVLCIAAALVLLFFFPEIATWLPERLMGPAS